MIKLKEAVIVEGKYDKIKLSGMIDAPIIETNGFRIFNDKEKLNLIKKLAQTRGILILTDSDGAGFVIRNYLKGTVPPQCVRHAYIPSILGKEKRKQAPSKEGTLGVEGMEEDILRKAIENSGAQCGSQCAGKREEITKADFYELGLTGTENSAVKRKALLKKLELPEYLSAKAMLDALNCIVSKEELLDLVQGL